MQAEGLQSQRREGRGSEEGKEQAGQWVLLGHVGLWAPGSRPYCPPLPRPAQPRGLESRGFSCQERPPGVRVTG